jgi:hypothetical protein
LSGVDRGVDKEQPAMTTTYRIGATEIGRLESWALPVGGRQLGDAGQRVPVGETHAVHEDGLALCGATDVVEVIDRDWAAATFVPKCSACRRLAA